MNLALKILGTLVVGTLLGLFVTWLTVVHGSMPGGISDGPWKANLSAGSQQSDPYTRARVAIHGLLALNRHETIYFTANSDSDGQALEGNCRYVLTGHDPDTRWWSITAYGRDDFLIPNSANRYSVSKTTVVREKDGSFKIAVGGPGGGANWIPVGTGSFTLTLRLYNPSDLVALAPETAMLPSLKKESCS